MARSRGRGLEVEQIKKAEEKAAEQAKEVRRKSVLTVLGIVVALGAVAAFIMLQPPPPGTAIASLGNQHIATLAEPHAPYNSRPPSSGPHLGNLAAWGTDAEEPLPPELFIHNLEDGGIVLAYDCPAGCDDIVAGFRDILGGGERVIMTPYEGIADQAGTPMRAAAVAWNRVYWFDEWNDDIRNEVEAFIRIYEGLDHHVR